MIQIDERANSLQSRLRTTAPIRQESTMPIFLLRVLVVFSPSPEPVFFGGSAEVHSKKRAIWRPRLLLWRASWRRGADGLSVCTTKPPQNDGPQKRQEIIAPIVLSCSRYDAYASPVRGEELEGGALSASQTLNAPVSVLSAKLRRRRSGKENEAVYMGGWLLGGEGGTALSSCIECEPRQRRNQKVRNSPVPGTRTRSSRRCDPEALPLARSTRAD